MDAQFQPESEAFVSSQLSPRYFLAVSAWYIPRIMGSPIIEQQFVTADLKSEFDKAEQRTATRHLLALGCFTLVLGLLAALHATDVDRRWPAENALLMLFVSVLASWSCPRAPVLVLTLSAVAVYFAVDLRREPEWWISIVRYSGRALLTVLSVLWTSRARQELKQAIQSARVDSLTGLPNRRAILETLDAELCRVRRFGRSFTIAMLDVDGFKTINDVQGHLAGDRALQNIAFALRKHIRAYDHVGRLGGDEFVLILPEASIDDIPGVFDRLRTELQIELNREYPTLTFSIGAVTIKADDEHPDQPLDSLDCLRRADQAMYVAKRAGRD